MKPRTLMLIAGEASGDLLAAELVKALRQTLADRPPRFPTDGQPLRANLAPQFFGAGGSQMAEAGVTLAFDLTRHAVVGLIEVLKHYRKFQRLFRQLFELAIERQPDAIICVDFSGFNRRFAQAIKNRVRAQAGPFHNWNPKIIQYVSPQVWASRPGRAQAMARDVDLLLSIFPFEQGWYATHAPRLRVEFVGHPVCDRFPAPSGQLAGTPSLHRFPPNSPLMIILPGSRVAELRRHLPIMLEAARQLDCHRPIRWVMVLPNPTMVEQARSLMAPWPRMVVQAGGLAESLAEASLAIASTGTVTMECAYFGVPTVALYKTSWSTYQIGKRLIKVKFLAMPNLLAGEEVFPEFIQQAATAENIARAALGLLSDQSRRHRIKTKLAEVIAALGGPGASRRAAEAIAEIL